MRAKYVIAGDHAQFLEFQSRFCEWGERPIYVTSEEILRGLTDVEIVYYGSWSARSDIDRILETVTGLVRRSTNITITTEAELRRATVQRPNYIFTDEAVSRGSVPYVVGDAVRRIIRGAFERGERLTEIYLHPDDFASLAVPLGAQEVRFPGPVGTPLVAPNPVPRKGDRCAERKCGRRKHPKSAYCTKHGEGSQATYSNVSVRRAREVQPGFARLYTNGGDFRVERLDWNRDRELGWTHAREVMSDSFREIYNNMNLFGEAPLDLSRLPTTTALAGGAGVREVSFRGLGEYGQAERNLVQGSSPEVAQEVQERMVRQDTDGSGPGHP